MANLMKQSPAEPRQGDDLPRQERMAELEREIAELVADNATAPGWSSICARSERLRNLRSELSRLRNEGGGGMWVTRNPAPDAAAPMAIGNTKTFTLPASPSDLPAREAIEQARSSAEFQRAMHLAEHSLNRADAGELDPDGDLCVLARQLKRHDERLDAIAALQPLSQGNGEAVAWQHRFSKNEDGVWSEWEHSARHLVKEYQSYAERMPKRYEVRPLYAAPPSQPEGVRSKQYGPTEWPGDVLREIYPSPGSPADIANKSEGVREALEKVAEICEDYARRFSISRPYNDGGVEQSYKEAAEQIRSLTTTPSRGLVEAAEWHDRMADAIPACDPYEKVAWHRDCAKALRTLSAKGGAG